MHCTCNRYPQHWCPPRDSYPYGGGAGDIEAPALHPRVSAGLPLCAAPPSGRDRCPLLPPIEARKNGTKARKKKHGPIRTDGLLSQPVVEITFLGWSTELSSCSIGGGLTPFLLETVGGPNAVGTGTCCGAAMHNAHAICLELRHRVHQSHLLRTFRLLMHVI